MTKWSLPWIAMSAMLVLGGCNLIGGGKRTPTPTQPANTEPVRFTEISEAAGIQFTHETGARGKKRMPETVGSGVAFLDYDKDGKLDILIINSCSWPDDPKPVRTSPKLYRNLGEEKFEDVTAKVGLERTFYGMGVSVGDYDNDGWEDIYLTAVGPNHFFRNNHGVFEDKTKEAGLIGVPLPGTKMEHKWSSSSAWLDYNKDGKLDLFVCQYVKWSPQIDPFCGRSGIRGYCPPGNFEGARCTLFRNEGNGTFKDVSKETGILDGALGKSFGIAIADYNGDGWLDIAVANDTWANFLFISEEGKRFTDKGVESGIAFAESGKAKAGMGIDVADFRNNGTFGLVIGNFAEEGLSLFEPMKDTPEMFEDSAQPMGIVAPSLLNVTFATFFFDYDLDGWQDILATNGHVDDIVNTYNSSLSFQQKPLLFRNDKGQKYIDVTKEAQLEYKIVGRGAAYGDIDNDGDLDVGIVDNQGKFLLFRNDQKNQNHWIRIKLTGTKSNRDALGTLVKLKAGGVAQQQYLKSGGGFLSENERVLTFGLGQATAIESLEIHWPSGAVEPVKPQAVDRLYHITEGKGFESI